jgi:hypothetical protein
VFDTVVPDPPWRIAATSGGRWSEATVICRRRLDAPAARAVAVVQHLPSLAVWEPKARHVVVTPTGPGRGSYTATGRVAGLVPWRATFDYELTGDGFHSWMPAARMGIQVAGGFRVLGHDRESCTIAHYEHYRLPLRNHLLVAAWRIWITHSMNAELGRIALLAARELPRLEPVQQPRPAQALTSV